jgi:hypothetical protein
MSEEDQPEASVVEPRAARARARTPIVVAAITVGALLAVGGIALAGVAATSAGGVQHPMSMTTSMPKAASDGAAVAVDTAGFPSGGKNPGIFTDICKHTLTAPNDPILMPGMTGESMQHDFFGNLAPTSTSTPASLVGGATNCTTSADSSAYWTPVLYQNGTALTPSATLIYWRAPNASAASVKSMPAGMSIIAGNEVANTPQDPRVIGWTCSRQLSLKLTSTPVDCPAGSDIRLVATFPNCWDGHTLDGSTQSNVVYGPRNGSCPTDHPVQIPQIVLHVNYPTSSAANLTLSIGPTQQGSILTGHADFMDGWNQAAMDRDVAACIATQTRCGPVTGADATPQGGKVLG